MRKSKVRAVGLNFRDVLNVMGFFGDTKHIYKQILDEVFFCNGLNASGLVGVVVWSIYID